ncbi:MULTISPECIES: cupin domain-containing protein [unclassified Brevibacillus]|uniref:cupin domain-containing protein n=1 Tax=unclassified Brevibacillus TaxID=2684853 RepID=UPI00156BBD8B|nr:MULTISPECIES: cupin domain-containing protein [unclassified Brevibacillus]MDH6350313.1 mannose-6-phosphate isomerase-like protein (cupin superfamily) [Brevibacillus sp. 1238]NRQ55817.1 cupin domain-containing protein [Brevibacillus sp. HD1.4A]
MYPSHYGYPWHPPVTPVSWDWDQTSWGHHWYPAYYPWYSNWESSWNRVELKDYGPHPLAINIDEATKQNNYYRTALWTGKHLQVTLMSIPVGGDIGLEIHPDTDQFFRIEDGHGLVQMGARKDRLDYQARLNDDYAVMVPAGTWHNIINTGNEPLKLYSIYAPPHHPHGTVHRTKAAAMAEERHHS